MLTYAVFYGASEFPVLSRTGSDVMLVEMFMI